MVAPSINVSKVVVHPPTLLQQSSEFANSFKTTSQHRSTSTVKERVVGDVSAKSGLSALNALSKSPGSFGTNDQTRGYPDSTSDRCVPRIMRSPLSESFTSNSDTAPSTPSSCFSSTSTVASTSHLPTMGSRSSEFRFPSECQTSYQGEAHGAPTFHYHASRDRIASHCVSSAAETRSSASYSAAVPISSTTRDGSSVEVPIETICKSPRVVIQTLESLVPPPARAPSARRFMNHCAPASAVRQNRQTPSVCTNQQSVSCPQVTQPREVEVDTLSLAGCLFDPAQPLVRRQLMRALGLHDNTHVEALQGHRGGLNDGVWFVRSQEGELVLKLVSGVSSHPAIPTEAASLQRISRANLGIVDDCDIAFPHKVLRLQGCPSGKPRDLIVMRRAPGLRLQEVISDKLHSGRRNELFLILEAVGTCVAKFHCKYGNQQHSDLTVANIMYDDSTGRVTLIDVGGMGDPQIHVKDVDHFPKSIELLTKHQDSLIANQLIVHFQTAYKRAICNK